MIFDHCCILCLLYLKLYFFSMPSFNLAPKSESGSLDNLSRSPEPDNCQNAIGNICNKDYGNLPNQDGKSPTSHDNDEHEMRFDGSGDQEDPRNFRTAREWLIVVVISLSSASV
jgi:hypothetical protein